MYGTFYVYFVWKCPVYRFVCIHPFYPLNINEFSWAAMFSALFVACRLFCLVFSLESFSWGCIISLANFLWIIPSLNVVVLTFSSDAGVFLKFISKLFYSTSCSLLWVCDYIHGIWTIYLWYNIHISKNPCPFVFDPRPVCQCKLRYCIISHDAFCTQLLHISLASF